MKPASYRAGLHWIVANDDTNWLWSQPRIESVTAAFLADMFGVEQERVTRDLIRYAKEAGLAPKRSSKKGGGSTPPVAPKASTSATVELPNGKRIQTMKNVKGEQVWLVGGVGHTSMEAAIEYAENQS